MSSSILKLKKKIQVSSSAVTPRGELWLGTRLFSASNLEDTAGNHLLLAEQLDHAVVCLPVSDPGTEKPDLGYRYFTVRDLERAVAASDRPVFAVLDGPFQEMVNVIGLMEVLSSWMSDRDNVIRFYNERSKQIQVLISRILKTRPAAIVITDDMAFDQGPIIRPEDLTFLCSGFYSQTVKQIHACGIPVLLHSCGNISALIPLFQTWAVDGFAAIQSTVNNLKDLFRKFDDGILIMAGIEGDLLDTDAFSNTAAKKLGRLVSMLGTDGSLILGSSCGLYKPEHLEQIRRIYALADKAMTL